MTGISFDSLLVVAVVAFAAPLAVGLAPGVRMPAVVLERVLGIALGPHALGWTRSSRRRSYPSSCSRRSR